MKILEFSFEEVLKPVGGPRGYLYNLKIENEKSIKKEVYFLKQPFSVRIKRFVKHSILPKFILSKYESHKQNISPCEDIKKVKQESEIDNSKCFRPYDVVHFHNTFDMYRMKKSLESYRGLVLLTSHSPKVNYKEVIEDLIDDKEYINNKSIYDDAEKFDEYAFTRADYIIFPCLGAEEPYFHSWPKYAELRDKSKIRYIPTGILPVDCKKTKSEVRQELNIPQDAIVLSFVGRHNNVKGYDLLQEIYSKFNNVYVVCCGNIGTIQPPQSDRWIEVGWTTDPYSYVGASDIYMLPNRETYFDIAMLQTLSIGKCSVISNTGGNKEFLNTPGVKLYDSLEDAVQCIKCFIEMDTDERNRLENLQRKEFNEKYTIDVFYKKYTETLKKLIEDRKCIDEI